MVCAHRCQGHTVIPRLTDPLGTWLICSRVDLCESCNVVLTLVHTKPRVNGTHPSKQKCAGGKVWLWLTVRAFILSVPFLAYFCCHALCIWSPARMQCISVPLNICSHQNRKGMDGPLLLSCLVKGLGVCPFLPPLVVEEPSTPDHLPLFLLLHYLSPGFFLISAHLNRDPFHCPLISDVSFTTSAKANVSLVFYNIWQI